MTRAGLLFFLSLLCALAPLKAREAAPANPEIMPLSEIKPGMTGTWRTVVKGSEIEEFNLEIVGISPNFAGPNSPVIIAKATDPSQILSGPVAGMSGSPCYIDGKLIGAYAYGYLWPKEQAIIGITPIDEMLKVFDKEQGEMKSASIAPRSSSPISIQDLPGPAKRFGFQFDEHGELTRSSTDGAFDRFNGVASASGSGAQPQLKPTPTPLLAGGLSPKTAALFGSYASAMGLELMAAPIGSVDSLTANDLVPGAPVGGILLDGDFPFVAVGTCSWRDGNQILAFGHPFLQGGEADIPIAPAEVMTVVQTVPSSFKLANAGPVVGSLYQDRLTAIAGEIGREPQLTEYAVNVTDATGVTRTYDGMLFQNEQLSPFISVLGLMMSTMATLEAGDDLSYNVELIAEYEGYEPLTWNRFAAGSGGMLSTLFRVWDVLGTLAENPFEKPSLNKLTFNVHLVDALEQVAMERLQMLSGKARPGQAVEVSIGLQGYREELDTIRVEALIPEASAGERLQLFIGDARSADRIDDGYNQMVESFGEMLDYYRTRRDNQRIYVKLIRPTQGISARGRSLYELPPSARELMQSPRTVEAQSTLREVTLWETSIETDGAFSGSHRFSVPVAKR